jgi:hypothetical protein
MVLSITLRDPLAELLGAAPGGLLSYSYADAVKLAGHSCPTVAGAYRATCEALARLYPGETPVRGSVRVEVRGAAGDGVVGVIAMVAGYITGAAGEGGFKGIAGHYARRGLLVFEAPISAQLRFTRLDTGASVQADLPEAPPDEDIKRLLRNALVPGSSPAHREAFARAWQGRVAHVLQTNLEIGS